MAHIDRLGWTDGFSIRPQGIILGVRSNQAGLIEKIKCEVLLPQWRVEPYRYEVQFSLLAGGTVRKGRRKFSLLYEGSKLLARALEPDVIYQEFEKALHARVALYSTAACCIPAVSIALGDRGVAILGCDSSWPVVHAEILRRLGASLLSASYAVLEPAGNLLPYANRILIDGAFQSF